MTENYKHFLYFETLKKYGTDKQMTVAIEECSEVQKELCKIIRKVNFPESLTNLAEEIADCQIMMEQVIQMWDLQDAVDAFTEKKLLRLEERLGIDYGKNKE